MARLLALFAFLAICFGSGNAARAQDFSFAIDPTAACLENQPEEARHDCIGRASAQCQTGNEGGDSTVGMGFCTGRELDWWDARLNEAYQQWLQNEKSDDAEARAEGWSTPQKLPALKQMQRTWIKYRDALCEHEAVQWGGGTGSGPAFLACLMGETARQYFVLVDRLESYTGN